MHRRNILPVILTLLLFAAPLYAQEPLYRVELPGEQKLTVVVRVSGGSERRVDVLSRDIGGVPPTHLIESTVTLDANSTSVSARSFFVAQNARHNPIYQEAKRAEPDSEGREVYQLGTPEIQGEIPVTQTLLTNISAMLFVGRAYDWAKGGTQTFAWLLDYAATLPSVHPIRLSANGVEEILIGKERIKARRLVYETELPFLPSNQRKGTLFIGKEGEVLKVESSLMVLPLTVVRPLQIRSDKRKASLELAGLPNSEIRGEFFSGTAKVTASIAGNEVATTYTDSRFSTVRHESLFLGRKMTSAVQNGVLRYRLEPTPPTTYTLLSGRSLFFPQWLATGTWEQGTGKLAKIAVGEKRDVDYFALHNGVSTGFFSTMERVDDIHLTRNAVPVVLSRYRLTTWSDAKKSKPIYLFDFYTDGEFAVAILSNTGVKIRRIGWESFTDTLKQPEIPKP
jgi:hypothetical protein